MLVRNEHPDGRIAYDLVATLHPRAVEALNRRGIPLEPEAEHDAAGPTSFVYVTSDDDEFLLVHHPCAPVPGVDVLTPTANPGALQRLVANLGSEPGLVTWQSDYAA